MTPDELFARAEKAMSDWYGYHDVQNPWCDGNTPDEHDQPDVDDWHKLFLLLGRAWDLIDQPGEDT